ncbi:class I SAM-dependent methyltransferase [Sphingomonas sp.]|uniref:class I SAM-dependent methyltransferase n=1 Tax=Sphingomonas sp. TaxID=28214 RepID=UPI003341673D
MPDRLGVARRLRASRGYWAANLLLDLARGRDRRHAALLRLRAPAGLFQPFGTTWPDRYAEIFADLSARLASVDAVRILSFGCSTGEEVAALRQHLPEADITGIDISPERIAICRATLPQAMAGRTRFEVGDSVCDEPDAHYDAVLAKAVFRHWRLNKPTVRNNTLLAFDRFEREVTEMARIVRPGGFLLLRHSNFRFCDTAVFAGFETLADAKCATPLFAPSGARLPDQTREAILFRKR